MRHKLSLLFVAVMFLVLVVTSVNYYRNNRGFSQWVVDLDEIIRPLEVKGADGRTFWDRRHWVTGVEGRWREGRMEWRVRVGDAPAKGPYWWYWWFNQDKATFNKRLLAMADEQFTLVYMNSFELPDGTKRYSGIWHRTHTPKKWKKE